MTVWDGLIGGLLIGTAAAVLLHTTGERAGISGIFFGVASGDASQPWRGVWLSGLMLTATVWSLFDESRFTSDPETKGNSFAGAAIGGFLVGLGTKLGSGCTSGHGVCGLARLSQRSLVAVVTFMTTGFAMATWVNNTQSFLTGEAQFSSLPTPQISYVSGIAALTLLIGMFHQGIRRGDGVLRLLFSFISACLFSVGLIYGGMTQRSKVVAFLNGLAWNPQLAFVMGGAVMVTFPAFTYAAYRDHTLLSCPYDKSGTSTITAPLILGAWLFGLGWGLSGLCPGPALAHVAAGIPLTTVGFFPFMTLGMYTYMFWNSLSAKKKAS
eukprot:gb/GECG01005812.1/.p1 GENE.gb/GECG01005812.1/~~gb/GECG01005812.1/.p1  ORF type:complete len:325 (+),score=6.46 gb/GECG01005812.1/:1-975(+)